MNGKEIAIDHKTIWDVLNMPENGPSLFCSKKWVTSDSFILSYDQVISTIYDNISLLDGDKVTNKALGNKWAQLHRVVNHIILPKGGSFDKVSYMDTLIQYALITKTLIPFGYVMMQHMKKSSNSGKPLSLHYEMLLTKFFQALWC